MKEIQLQRLRNQLHKVCESSDFYKSRIKGGGVRPEDVKTLEDVICATLYVKSDLRDHYPTGLFAALRNQVIRYHASSGTTGKPMVAGYTQSDIEAWTDSLARALTSCGLGREDVIQVSYGYGLFAGGLGLHCGTEKIGVVVVPTSVGNISHQIELMQDLEVTAIACTPSYPLNMGEVAE